MLLYEEIQQLEDKLTATIEIREELSIILAIMEKSKFLRRTDTEHFIDRLMQIADIINEPIYSASGLYYRALARRYAGEHVASLKLARQAFAIFEQIGSTKGMSVCYNNIGLVYEDQGDYPEALKTHFLALKLHNEIDNKAEIATSYNNIGLIHCAQGDYAEALKDHFICLKIREEMGDKEHVATSYINIGDVYEKQGKYPEALQNFLLALDVSEQTGNQEYIATALTNIGSVYEKQNKYAESLQHHYTALGIYQQTDGKRGIAHAYFSIGSIFFSQGDYPAAQKNLLWGLEMAENIGFKTLIKEVCRVLFDFYKAQNDFESALRYHEKYHLMHNDLINEQARKQLTDLTFHHNVEQIEKNLELEKTARNVEAEKNTLLSVQKELIEKSLHEREVLLREIHHRVKNNLQVISSLLELQSAGIDDAQAKAAINEGQNRVRSIALIHNKLYQNDDMAAIEFKNFVLDLYKQIAGIFRREGQEAEVHIDMEETLIDIDTAVPLGLIVNELITNAFKYAFRTDRSGSLSFRLLTGKDGTHELVIRDNGGGLPAGIDLKKTRSLGLRLIYNLSRQIGGSAEYHYDNGSIFTIRFADTRLRKIRD